jgi:hypothetical protein
MANVSDEGVYKFIHASRMDDVLDGLIKVGSLTHYRKLEETQWIADKLEGRVVLDAGGITITQDTNELDQMLPPSLAGRHAVAESGGTITYAPGVRITIEHPEVYIFSASNGKLAELRRVMCDGADEPYDACIQIFDLRHLAHRLFHRGVVPELDGARMSDLFQSFECSQVAYDVLLRSRGSSRAPEVSPFLKNVFFAAQQEARIVLYPRRSIPSSTFVVRVPRANQLFKEVFRGTSDRPASGSS